MSKADELAAKLKQTRHTHADDITCAELEIDCWPAQVYDLYHRIEAWLQPVTEVGLKIRRNPTHICETSPDGESHDYAIDQLVIEANNQSLTFDPIARFTEDGAGRVQITLPDRNTYLLRTVDEHGESHWWLQTVETGQELDAIALTENNLLQVVQEGLGL
ncbi:hypothetical protein PHLH6_39010 [Pseudomonas sp. Seg1]|uniref:hypothetical protein n=1 Tax=unclassified Pseudomonas TaxID=196821 RepID=UPI000CD131BE|nr:MULTISPECIES: hypothetical protein [unclassified Pseudomonas]POA44714.1 hypothetical protein C1893_25170 [Pseudomonas sp. MPR-ANC1]BBP71897.1 hypothetical protein PHLH6_39010 [Pseudomonas sp. Seg1]